MDGFADTYMDTMHRTLDYPISRTGEELRSLAIECYNSLRDNKKNKRSPHLLILGKCRDKFEVRAKLLRLK